MDEKLPTPRELMKKVGVEHNSVAYQASRTILNNLDKPVIAYGLGYAGFVCIIKTCQNFLKGYTYSVKHIGCSYPDGGFAELEIEKVIEVINGNKLIVEKGLDDGVLENGKIKPDYLNLRPVIATLEYQQRTSYDYGGKNNNWGSWDNYKQRLVRLKNGRIRAESYYKWKNKFALATIREFINNSEQKEGVSNMVDYTGKVIKDKQELKFTKKDIPEDILQEAKDQLLIKEI